MNFEKYTDKSRQIVERAQALALRSNIADGSTVKVNGWEGGLNIDAKMPQSKMA